MNNITLIASGISSSMDTTRTFSERMLLGAEVSLLGLAVVFAVLALLWGLLSLFRFFFYDIPNRKKSAETEQIDSPSAEANTSIVIPTAPTASSDDELVAAISAAVAAYMNAEGTSSGFKVVSFRRK